MKRSITATILLACLLFSIGSAEARNRPQIEVASGWGWGSSQAATPIYTHSAGRHSGNLPGPCYAALSHGSYGTLKPCGCYAQGRVFGTYERWMVIGGRKVNLWLASTWAQVFPRTTPHAGAVAVWPGHVAYIVGVLRAGYITVADSWQTHDVRTPGLIVEPSR
jgi:hypothetical protein